MNSHRVGDIAEAHVLAALSERYQAVLIPFGNGQRYDFVVDTGESFLKVQVKNGRLRKGCVVFNSRSVSSQYNAGYEGQIDFFAVWCPETKKVYMIPIEKVTSQKPYLRVDPLKTNRTQGIVYASSYEV